MQGHRGERGAGGSGGCCIKHSHSCASHLPQSWHHLGWQTSQAPASQHSTQWIAQACTNKAVTIHSHNLEGGRVTVCCAVSPPGRRPHAGPAAVSAAALYTTLHAVCAHRDRQFAALAISVLLTVQLHHGCMCQQVVVSAAERASSPCLPTGREGACSTASTHGQHSGPGCRRESRCAAQPPARLARGCEIRRGQDSTAVCLHAMQATLQQGSQSALATKFQPLTSLEAKVTRYQRLIEADPVACSNVTP